MHLGEKIKIARVPKGLTQHDLAELIHKTRPLISHIELTGKVNPFTLQEICKVLDMDISSLNIELGLVSESENQSYISEIDSIRKENQQLKQEIETLRELVSSQKHLFELLKQK